MTDIVKRIRGLRYVHVPVASDLMAEAAAEIERLRLELSAQKACTVAGREEIARLREAIRRLADQDATLSVQDGNVTITLDATLTDEERKAIYRAEARLRTAYVPDDDIAATLRSLLERLHT
jgi:hypothetical protein